MQPLVFVRGTSSLVEPTPTGVAVLLGTGVAPVVVLPSSQVATPPW